MAGYKPLPNPLTQKPQFVSDRPLTYEEFLAMKNGSPGNGALVGNQAGQPDPTKQILDGLFTDSAKAETASQAIPNATGITEAGNAAWNAQAGEASQAAWNAGADAASGNVAAEAAPTILGNAAELGAGPLAAIVAGTVLGGKAGYDMLKGKRPKGPLGTIGRATLGVATGGLSEVANRLINGTKSQDQQGRDRGRKALQGAGFANDKFGVNLADGSSFNIGLDGGTSYQNLGKNIDGKTSRHAYDVDFSNPAAVALIPQVKTQVMKLLGPNASEKELSDLTGQLINAATSQGDGAKNVESIFSGNKGQAIPRATTAAVPAQKTQALAAAPTPNAIPRTSTKSPDIGLDGKPVNLWSRK